MVPQKIAQILVMLRKLRIPSAFLGSLLLLKLKQFLDEQGLFYVIFISN